MQAYPATANRTHPAEQPPENMRLPQPQRSIIQRAQLCLSPLPSCMTIKPNICPVGRRIRMRIGTTFATLALITAAIAWFAGLPWLWPVAGGLAVGASLGIGQAITGVCVARACGWKTKI